MFAFSPGFAGIQMFRVVFFTVFSVRVLCQWAFANPTAHLSLVYNKNTPSDLFLLTLIFFCAAARLLPFSLCWFTGCALLLMSHCPHLTQWSIYTDNCAMQVLSLKSLAYFLAFYPHGVPPFREVGTKFIRLAVLSCTLCTAPAVFCQWGLLKLGTTLIWVTDLWACFQSHPFCPRSSLDLCVKYIVWCQYSSTAWHCLLIWPQVGVNTHTYICIHTHMHQSLHVRIYINSYGGTQIYVYIYTSFAPPVTFQLISSVAALSPQSLDILLHATSLLQEERSHLSVTNPHSSLSSPWNVSLPESTSEPHLCVTLPLISLGELVKF